MCARAAISFAFELSHWQSGATRIAGVDEAGRGPLAGPVVAAAAILPPRWADTGLPPELAALNDSKQLSASTRQRLFDYLRTCGQVEYGIGLVDASLIDEINILQATHRAMSLALAQLAPAPAHALVDGRPVKTLTLPHTAIVQGDGRSYSIAAASVLAKVTRDHLMHQLDSQFPQYGFAVHKGYGTARHLDALAQFGPCPIHRHSFAPIKQVAPPPRL